MENNKNKKEIFNRVKIRLNLISPDRKEKIAEEGHLKLVIKLEVLMSVLLIIFFAVLGSFWYILSINFSPGANPNQEEKKGLQYEKIKNHDEQFSRINSQISEIAKINSEQMYWSVLFAKLSSLVFPGISVEALSTSDYSVTVLGVASTRDDLILFKEKLEGESCFSGVNLPLSDLVGKDNVEFQIEFDIKKDCLRKDESKN